MHVQIKHQSIPQHDFTNQGVPIYRKTTTFVNISNQTKGHKQDLYLYSDLETTNHKEWIYLRYSVHKIMQFVSKITFGLYAYDWKCKMGDKQIVFYKLDETDTKATSIYEIYKTKTTKEKKPLDRVSQSIIDGSPTINYASSPYAFSKKFIKCRNVSNMTIQQNAIMSFLIYRELRTIISSPDDSDARIDHLSMTIARLSLWNIDLGIAYIDDLEAASENKELLKGILMRAAEHMSIFNSTPKQPMIVDGSNDKLSEQIPSISQERTLSFINYLTTNSLYNSSKKLKSVSEFLSICDQENLSDETKAIQEAIQEADKKRLQTPKRGRRQRGRSKSRRTGEAADTKKADTKKSDTEEELKGKAPQDPKLLVAPKKSNAEKASEGTATDPKFVTPKNKTEPPKTPMSVFSNGDLGTPVQDMVV